jgi:hypothetical protein
MNENEPYLFVHGCGHNLIILEHKNNFERFSFKGLTGMENVSCGEPNTAYFSHGGPHNIFRTGRSL